MGEFSLLDWKSCQTCPAGMFCADPDTEPALCATGLVSDGGRTACFVCPPGYECPEQKALTACAPGFYSLAGDLLCTRCPDGHECVDQGAYPVKCRPGMYATHAGGHMECTICPANMYCPDASTLPANCPDGYTSAAGSTVCTADRVEG